ncbi:MAG: histidine phosphatase family protein [Acidimicrobiia bacterium]
MTKPICLWLVRHGATDWTSIGRLAGWTDISLNAEGRAQAAALRPRLAEVPFASIWSSDLSRATQTARLAWKNPNTDRRLRELDFGSIEGTTWQNLERSTQQALLQFDTFSAPEGESVTDLQTRVDNFLAHLQPGRHLIFTHAGVIRVILRATSGDRHVYPGQQVTVHWPTGRH